LLTRSIGNDSTGAIFQVMSNDTMHLLEVRPFSLANKTIIIGKRNTSRGSLTGPLYQYRIYSSTNATLQKVAAWSTASVAYPSFRQGRANSLPGHFPSLPSLSPFHFLSFLLVFFGQLHRFSNFQNSLTMGIAFVIRPKVRAEPQIHVRRYVTL